MGVFEDFVNANLPLRVVQYNPLNSGYDGDPNSGGAPIQIRNAVRGAFYYNTTGSLYVKETPTSGSWTLVGSGQGGGGAGEVSASYLVLGATASLANERIFSVGTGLSASDGGAGGFFHVTAPFVSATYLVFSASGEFPNERILTAGTGVYFIDNGPTGSFELNAPENFSYFNIVTGSKVVIPANQQMIYDGNLTVDGDLVVDGQLVENNDAKIAYSLVNATGYTHISGSPAPSPGDTLIAISSDEAAWGPPTSGGASDWILTGSTLSTTSSVSILDSRDTFDIGEDIGFYVSGTITSGSAGDMISVFGGSVRVSGTLAIGSGSLILTENSIENTQGSLTLYDSSTTTGVAVSALSQLTFTNASDLIYDSNGIQVGNIYTTPASLIEAIDNLYNVYGEVKVHLASDLIISEGSPDLIFTSFYTTDTINYRIVMTGTADLYSLPKALYGVDLVLDTGGAIYNVTESESISLYHGSTINYVSDDSDIIVDPGADLTIYLYQNSALLEDGGGSGGWLDVQGTLNIIARDFAQVELSALKTTTTGLSGAGTAWDLGTSGEDIFQDWVASPWTVDYAGSVVTIAGSTTPAYDGDWLILSNTNNRLILDSVGVSGFETFTGTWTLYAGNVILRTYDNASYAEATQNYIGRRSIIVDASVAYKFPPDGTYGQVLSTDGTGKLTWATAAGGDVVINEVLTQGNYSSFTTIHTYTVVESGTDSIVAYDIMVHGGNTSDEHGLFKINALFRRTGSTVTQQDVTFVNGPLKQNASMDIQFSIVDTSISLQVKSSSTSSSWKVTGYMSIIDENWA